jgi:uncharacterized protein
LLTNHAKIMQFFSMADGVTGRKKLQKMIYILQKCNIPFEEKYHFHVYGPYSEELTLRVEELCNFGFLDEVKEDKSNYFQYNYTITTDGEAFLEQFNLDMPSYQNKVDMLKARSSRFLELVSTMLYFDDLPIKETIEKVHTVKPKQKFSEDEIEEAISFIKEITQS